MKKSYSTILAVGVALAANAAIGHAAILPVASEIPAVATTDNPQLGSLVATTGVQPYAAPTFSGILIEEVRQESITANPLGGLTFIFQVTSNPGSLTDIERLTSLNFAGYTVDATYFSTGIQQAPDNFTRSSGGLVVAANFGVGTSALNASDLSTWMVFRTDAPAYASSINSVIDGGTASLSGFAPVPEPAGLGLLGVGAIALLRRRR